MKITTTSFIAALCGATLCHAQGNVVYYGANSNALAVVFADTTLAVPNAGRTPHLRPASYTILTSRDQREKERG